MTTYRAVVTREGDAWLADVPEVQGAHTYARTISRLDKYVREVIAGMLDLPEGAEDGLSVEYEYHTGDTALDERLAKARADRARIEAESRELEATTADLATLMSRRTRLSVRDAAKLLGVSPGRISQLAPTASRESVDA